MESEQLELPVASFLPITSQMFSCRLVNNMMSPSMEQISQNFGAEWKIRLLELCSRRQPVVFGSLTV